jgi:hypothetical protein
MIDGDLSGRWEGIAFATWEDADQRTVRIGQGDTRTLAIAQLDVTAFPFAQWQVYVTQEDGRQSVLRAMHTSTIGADQAARAPTMFLEVSVFSRPDAIERVRPCTIALHAFDAQHLRS